MKVTRAQSALFLSVIFLILQSCNKESDFSDYPAGSSEKVNAWVRDSMQVYYYWQDDVPDYISKNHDIQGFFNMLKHPSDRFSALVNSARPETYPPSLSHTMGFDLVSYSNSTGTTETVVTLVVPGSAAAVRGLARGDRIRHINNTVPSAGNIDNLLSNIISNRKADLDVEGKGTLAISNLTYNENPVYQVSTFRFGGSLYGYLFLNSFEPTAILPLIQAFEKFNQEQIGELILDLRYNPGGSIPVAAAVASMVVPSGDADRTFVVYRGNSNVGELRSSFADELFKLPAGNRWNYNQLQQYHLKLNKIYVLTGNHTASAAELLINALRPYLTVVQCGDRTLGKDMASIMIKDYRSPQVVPDWEIYPMIFKLYNSLGKGEYSSGMVPDRSVNELSALPLKPFGDISDPLIRSCLPVIANSGRSSLQNYDQGRIPEVVFDSQDRAERQPGWKRMLIRNSDINRLRHQ